VSRLLLHRPDPGSLLAATYGFSFGHVAVMVAAQASSSPRSSSLRSSSSLSCPCARLADWALPLLADHSFSHDDAHPYFLRIGDTWTPIDYTKHPSHWMHPLKRGSPTGLVEIPSNWYLDGNACLISLYASSSGFAFAFSCNKCVSVISSNTSQTFRR